MSKVITTACTYVVIVLTFIEQHKAELSLRNLKKQPVEDASDEYRLTQFGPSQLKLGKKVVPLFTKWGNLCS